MKLLVLLLALCCALQFTLIVGEDAYLRRARDEYCAARPNCTHCSFLEDHTRGISFYGIDHGQKYRIRRIAK